MARQDDPTLAGEIKVLRRIPPTADRVRWDDNNTPIPSSQNFRDNRNDELSMFIASETTPDQILKGVDGYGLVELTLREIREIYAKHTRVLRVLIICRDEGPDDGPGHILVCGKPSPRMNDELRECAKWVPGRLPARIQEQT
jgi:hypothetical protein